VNKNNFAKNALTIGNIASVLIATIGYFFAYWTFVRVPVQQNLQSTETTQQHMFIALSKKGQLVAQGFISPCSSSEPIAVHSCPVANNLRAMINSMLKNGKTVKQVREYLLKTFGQKIKSQ
jgi:cytochrome c-type biogenesis protein CcmH/NrfF